jgi:hypothetical protein
MMHAKRMSNYKYLFNAAFEIPEIPETIKIPETVEIPETAKTIEIPEIPKTHETVEIPEIPKTHETVETIFICPIGQEIMTDPVFAEDGYTYERSNIIKWLNENGTSPMTRKKIGTRLTTNNSLRSEISNDGHLLKPLENIPLENKSLKQYCHDLYWNNYDIDPEDEDSVLRFNNAMEDFLSRISDPDY